MGNETADDAAVWELDDGTCLIATTDFFAPTVDEPAVHALTDVTGSCRSLNRLGAATLQLSPHHSGAQTRPE